MNIYTYDEMLDELPEILNAYKNGDFDDLLEKFDKNLVPDDLYEAVSEFTLHSSAYFDALIRFLEFIYLFNGINT